MKEWDAAAYMRKFGNTLTRVLNVKTGVAQTVFVTGATGTALVGYARGSALVEPPQNYGYSLWEPQYKYVPSGYIARDMCIVREHRKLFYVGVNHQTHTLYYYDSRKDRQCFRGAGDISNDTWIKHDVFGQRPVFERKDKEQALAEWGAISNRLFLGPTDIHYMWKKVGTRNGKDFHLPLYNTVQQELYDALREVL